VKNLFFPFGRDLIDIYAPLGYKIETVTLIPVKKNYLPFVEIFINRYLFDLRKVALRQSPRKAGFLTIYPVLLS